MTAKLLILHKKRFNKTALDNSHFTVLRKGSLQVSELVEMEDCSEKAEPLYCKVFKKQFNLHIGSFPVQLW